MYNHIWKKYLPVIKILIKKCAGGQQVLALDRLDFDKAGAAKKTGNKFTIEFSEGKIANTISSSALAMALVTVMQEDEGIRQILNDDNYLIELNTKFQLIIKNTTTGE